MLKNAESMVNQLYAQPTCQIILTTYTTKIVSTVVKLKQIGFFIIHLLDGSSVCYADKDADRLLF